MYFTTLNVMKTNLGNGNPTLLQNMIFGFTARSVVGTVMLPIAVIKTRYESGRFHYRTVSEALANIWRAEGMRGRRFLYVMKSMGYTLYKRLKFPSNVQGIWNFLWISEIVQQCIRNI